MTAIRVGLRAKLLGLTLVLLGVLTAGALGAVYYYIGQQVREQAELTLRSAAHVLTSILLRTEEQLLGRGRILVELPSLRAGLTDHPKDLEPLLQEVKSLRTANLLWATDPTGTVLASTGEYPPVGASLANHPLIAHALAGQKALGFDAFTNEWWLVLCLPVTAPDAPKPIGTVALALLIGEAYLDRLAELIETEVGFVWNERRFWSTGWPAEIRSQIASQEPVPAGGATPQAMGTATGTTQELGVGQGRYLWTARQVTIGVDPAVSRPLALLGIQLDESVIRETARAIGWIALIVIAAGLVILFGAIRSITQPLKSLVADTQRVGAGDLAHRAAVRGADEVAELATSFNEMVGSLERSKQELLEAKRYTDSIIQRMINSLIVADAEGRIRIMNPATADLLGYAEEELIGQPLSRLFADEGSPFGGIPWEAFLQQGVLRNAECLYRSKHGKPIPVLFSSAVMRGDQGQVQGVVCVAQDITERKYLERLKDHFINTVSHELRTPLASLSEGVSLMLDGVLGAINDEQRTFLQMTSKETERLKRLVNTLLDLSMIEGGKLVLDRQPVDLAELVDRTCRLYQGMVGKRTLVRRVGAVPRAYADPARVLQILDHLVSNALQFSPDDGTIAVSVEPRDGLLAVSVANTGAGIPREELGQLFRRFVQLGRLEEERPGGAGLGLALCKKLVELHGGTIWVTSEVGQGASFTFTLPRCEHLTKLS
jgi:two-component system sensor histidine kinase VicK